MVRVSLEDYGWFLIELSIFNFSSNFTGPDLLTIFSFWTLTEHVSYASKKLLIKQKTSSTWWGFLWRELWMVSDRIVDFQFFVKFHRSGPALIFSFWTLTEHVSYASKKLLIKQKTSSRWWVLLWKNYGWFLTELSIFNFSSNSNFTGPDLQ